MPLYTLTKSLHTSSSWKSSCQLQDSYYSYSGFILPSCFWTCNFSSSYCNIIETLFCYSRITHSLSIFSPQDSKACTSIISSTEYKQISYRFSFSHFQSDNIESNLLCSRFLVGCHFSQSKFSLLGMS